MAITTIIRMKNELCNRYHSAMESSTSEKQESFVIETNTRVGVFSLIGCCVYVIRLSFVMHQRADNPLKAIIIDYMQNFPEVLQLFASQQF